MKSLISSLLLILLAATSITSTAQDGVRIIRLKQERLMAKPANFHITAVKDDRADTSTIGSVRAGIFSRKEVSLNLPGGAAKALDEFLKTNLAQQEQRLPIVLHISQLEVAEQTGGLKSESEVRMTIGFYGGGQKIMEYKGSNTIQAGVDASRYIEQLIRKSLDNMLQQFDAWCAGNKEQVQAALNGPSIHIEAEIKEDVADTERIAYSPLRPLTLDDFTGKPDDLSRAAAITYSGLDVKYKTESQFGQTKIMVTILPFFDKTRSWCRAASHNKKTLLHEQQHFNITAIKACELATALKNTPFTVSGYMKELEQLYRQKEKEIAQWQEQYDQETRHGLIAAAQDQWVTRIQDSIRIQPCYRR
ncbi:MAG TPA: hypothetical protein VNS58_32040 [Puia sp.]|nr:hypothetical protein [Puia sp.]